MRKFFALLLGVGLVMSSSGCATLENLDKDLKQVGRAIDKAIDGLDNKAK